MSTELAYLLDSELYQAEGTVRRVEGSMPPSVTVVLDSTIFYPQGGGQPTDRGFIKGQAGTFRLDKAIFVEGEVLHTGQFIEGGIANGEVVQLNVDSLVRQHHARLHTGGHLVMTAVDRLLGLPAIKGYHFPDGPYVEFKGSVPVEERAAVLESIQQVLDEIVKEDSEVSARFDTVENLRAAGVYMPGEVPEGKPTRVVVTSGYQSPCGGTHVKRLGQVTGLVAKGIKSKSGNTRVSYTTD